MAEFVLQGAGLDITTSTGTVNFGDHVKSLTINYSAELQDNTAMTLGTRRRIPGLFDWSVNVTLNQDFAANSVDAILFGLIGSTAVTLAMRVESTSDRGATNPEFTGLAVLESYDPIGNAVGESVEVTATFQAAGTMTRVVSAS